MTTDPTSRLPGEIESLIAALRWRIRAYVWIEGLALTVIWLGLTFWAGLAVDYLPVMLGASEMPQGARAMLLAIIALVSLLIFYRWIGRRAFIPLSGRSMAVLLERRFRDFHDGLLTSVEMAEHPEHAETFSRDMLATTNAEALEQLPTVRVGSVFNFGPLLRSLAGAALVVASVVLFGVLANDAFARWVDRLYLLSPEDWPRQARIEVLGMAEHRVKIARGSDFLVRVRADADRHVPETCSIHYRTAEGSRGRVPMSRAGQIRLEGDRRWQHFEFSGKPFAGVLSDIRFDVVGFDHRVRDLLVEVVESPAVVDVQLDCELPEYTGLLRRTETWTVGKQLPRGTSLTIRATANKPLAEVRLHDVQQDRHWTETVDGADQFVYHVERLEEDVVLDIALRDADMVESDQPYRLLIGVRDDDPPEVDVVLRGIGTAITPDARIPATGEVGDDYAVGNAWFELELPDADGRRFPVELQSGGRLESALDLREQRTRDDDAQFELEVGQSIGVTLRAADKCDLGDGPNVGQSDRYQLEVVTPDELLKRLENRELGLRQRLEQIIDEMKQSRDTLVRVRQYDNAPAADAAEPEDDAAAEPEDAPVDAAAAAERARSLRLLRVQRAIQYSERAAQEVLGVAASIDDVRLELVNNRVDSRDRQTRLKELIADPLRLVSEQMLPELTDQLRTLEPKLDDPEAGSAGAAAAIDQADVVIMHLEEVLLNMLDVETFNQLIDIVRDLIEQQEDLSEQTKQEQKKQILDLLESPQP